MKRSNQDISFSEFQTKRKIVQKHETSIQNPGEIKIIDFAKCRASEVEALSKVISRINSAKTISQRLPRHMRRRAMSHEVKRLPRRLREAAINKMVNSTKANPNKRPSRKFRRQPKHLLEEYNRRQTKCCWLETHIWHAKRFHMVEKWGYKLAHRPCDKSIRACYQAASKYCLLQDTSFMCCLEIQGPEDKIIESLRPITRPEKGPTIAAEAYLSGRRYGQTIFFAQSLNCIKPLALVSFMWKPCQYSSNTIKGRQLWIWSHPSCFQQVIQTVQGCFIQEGTQNESCGRTKGLEEWKDDKELSKKSTLNVFTSKDGLVTVRSLKDCFARFKLTGPLTGAVLSQTLQPAQVDGSETKVTDHQDRALWWEQYFTNEDNKKMHEEQREVWTQLAACQSPAEVPPSLVLGLTVRDPRVLLPQKKYLVEQNKKESDSTVVNIHTLPACLDHLSPSVSDSPLWDMDVRKGVNTTKMGEHELNSNRAKHLVPGTPLNLGWRESRIPILLVQQPGFRPPVDKIKSQMHGRIGYGSGWDLIVPAGFGMAFHLAMVYRGARVGGLQEAMCVAGETKELIFPDDFPDTPAGEDEQTNQRKELKMKYEGRPPAKRINYVKLGISAPFHCPWQNLVSYWALKHIEEGGMRLKKDDMEVEFYVMRNKRDLRLLNVFLIVEKSEKPGSVDNDIVATDVLKMVDRNTLGLVPVVVTMLGRGIPLKFAHICIPTEDDLRSLQQDKTYAGPKEQLHQDPSLAEKKKKKKIKNAAKIESDSRAAATDHFVDKTVTTGSQTNLHTLSYQSVSRPVIGYISYGDFALGQGQGTGKGFCSVIGIHQLKSAMLNNNSCVALVRNTTTLQYRFVYISLINSY